MSPDWSLVPTPIPFATLDNPQSLNLYSYVRNNPLSKRDLDGHHQECAPDTSTTDRETGAVTVHAGACHEAGDGFFGHLGSILTALNPFGKLGGPAHRATVNRLSDMLSKEGYEVQREVKIPTPRGSKGSRFVDVLGVKKSIGETQMYQVGASNKDGTPVAREFRALDDIQQATGIRPDFVDKSFDSKMQDFEAGFGKVSPLEGEPTAGEMEEPEVPIGIDPL